MEPTSSRPIIEAIEFNLEEPGYGEFSVRDGEDGLRKARKEAPHVVLLDLMLPGLDRLEICCQLQQEPATRLIPVIMLMGKILQTAILLGPELGPDDYITRLFCATELLARVRAVLRRGSLKEGGSESRVFSRRQLLSQIIEPIRGVGYCLPEVEE